MKRNLEVALRDLDGKLFEDGSVLKTVLFNAVVAPLQADATLSTDKKMALYGLAKRVHAGGVQDFTAEEIALMKERIAVLYNVLVIGQVFELLDSDYSEPLDTAA